MLTSLLANAARLPTLLFVGLTVALAFGESAVLLDLIVPGEVGIVFIGAAADERGTSLTAMVVLATVAAVAGDSFGYIVGRRWGWTLVRRWGWIERRLEGQMRRAERYFDAKGGVAVVTGRWVGALRAVVPVVAGAARMPYPRFLAWDLPATLAWVAVMMGLGHTLGAEAAETVDRLGWIPLVVVAVVVGAVLIRRRVRRSAET